MTEHRWRLWRAYLQQGLVRYSQAQFKCRACQRWHAVTGKFANLAYDQRFCTLEDKAMDGLRTSATHGCQFPRKALEKKKRQEVPNGAGPEAATIVDTGLAEPEELPMESDREGSSCTE